MYKNSSKFRSNNRFESTSRSSKRSYGRSGFGSPKSQRNTKVWPLRELMDVIEREAAVSNTVALQNEPVEVLAHNSFDDFEIASILKQSIKEKGYTLPTPIQDQVIPAILDGKDVIASANTGTGKTAAFLIPLIDKVYKDRKKRVLIVNPTRELAAQTYDEFRSLSKNMGIFIAQVIGGVSSYSQKEALRRRPNFVVGTPGRIKDLINQKALDIAAFNIVVLDETDTMVDFGFVHEIKYLISVMSKERQSLFFSATISPKVDEILKSFVKDGVSVSVKKRETPQNIEQKVIRVVSGQNKIDVLHEFLLQAEFEKVLVFGKTKRRVQQLADELVSRGHKAGAIHGDKAQIQRQKVLKKFKLNEIDVLLATDVASRGLDINNVSHVINYDMPESLQDYIHRIGRTGRIDKKGVALTFI